MLNFVLCDDNERVRKSIYIILESIFIKHTINAQIGLSANNAQDVIKYIENTHVDVLLVDYSLGSNQTGIDIANTLRSKQKDAYIIFLSGYMDFVFESLKTKIFDYILKPITIDKLEQCILRLLDDMSCKKSKYIKLGKNRIILNTDDILCIEKSKMKCIIYMKSDKEITIYESLENLQSFLSDNFIRCHKSYIVNLDKISEINFLDNIIIFNEKIYCSLGPKYKSHLLEVINNDYFYTDFINIS